MSPEIEMAIQRGKTCAPFMCDYERTCFVLAMELERVYKLLEPVEVVTERHNVATDTDAPTPHWEDNRGLPWNHIS
jgi:hypothetical protein